MVDKELLGVNPDLQGVVDEGEERREREGHDKDGDEAELDH